MPNWQDNEELNYFREYLRIPSVHPNPDYAPCVRFLEKQAQSLALPMRVFYPVNKDNPVVVISWLGTEPALASILLNSHMDVVPVFEEHWTHPPFAAELDAVHGKIYARGAQDMKCVGMQYLGAIRALKRSGVRLKRTIHLSYVADEELGGNLGMRPFVQTAEFKALNVGFCLDEGLASPNEEFPLFYAERSVWRIHFHISGAAGHGSLLLKNTAGEKFEYILKQLMALRKREEQRLADCAALTIGDVTTINLTRVNGGVQTNVIPPKIVAGFDVRLALDVDQSEFEARLNKWCSNAGDGIEIVYEAKRPRVEPTPIDATNPFWLAFKKATDSMALKIKTLVFPGGTDSRYVREAGIWALGFSPMNNTPVLLHDHDEYIQADVYLRGIEIYQQIITNIANV